MNELPPTGKLADRASFAAQMPAAPQNVAPYERRMSRRILCSLLLSAICPPIVEAQTGILRRKAPQAETALTIYVKSNDWGNVTQSEVQTILAFAGQQLTRHLSHESLPTVDVWTGKDLHSQVPTTRFERGNHGEFVVALNAHDRYWGRYGFEFGHELTHVLIRSRDFFKRQRRGANEWFEEALAHAGSLYVVQHMADEWKVSPPNSLPPNFYQALYAYVDDYKNDKATLVAGPRSARFADWLRQNLKSLRQTTELTDRAQYVGLELLPLLEKYPEGWESIRYLFQEDSDLDRDFYPLLRKWRSNCPAPVRAFPEAVIAKFGAVDALPAPQSP